GGHSVRRVPTSAFRVRYSAPRRGELGPPTRRPAPCESGTRPPEEINSGSRPAGLRLASRDLGPPSSPLGIPRLALGSPRVKTRSLDGDARRHTVTGVLPELPRLITPPLAEIACFQAARRCSR